MERKYTYKNGTVYITGYTEQSLQNIREKTEEFLKKVVKEGQVNGHGYKSKRVRAK